MDVLFFFPNSKMEFIDVCVPPPHLEEAVFLSPGQDSLSSAGHTSTLEFVDYSWRGLWAWLMLLCSVQSVEMKTSRNSSCEWRKVGLKSDTLYYYLMKCVINVTLNFLSSDSSISDDFICFSFKTWLMMCRLNNASVDIIKLKSELNWTTAGAPWWSTETVT